jgi:hypothetical protein
VIAGIGAGVMAGGAATQGGSAALADSLGASIGPEGSHDGADLIAHHFAELARSSGSDIEAVMAILRRSGPPLDPAGLAGVAADTLVVIGDRDAAGPGEPLAGAIPGARLVTLPGVDHFATPKSMGFLDAGLRHLGAG